MCKTTVGILGVIGLGVTVTAGPHLIAQGGQGGRGGRGGEGQAVVLERAPKDHAIVIPREKLAQHLKDMDAKHLQTLRMIEGGKYNVNIRRITNAETALVHPKTIDLWVVLDGSGTLTTGGKIESGKMVGGQSRSLKVGDVEFIPAGLPHGVSGVNGNITWLNVRWDTDWPENAEVGAGNMPPGSGRGRAAAGGGGAAGGEGRGRGALPPIEYAPTDHSVAIPLEKLDTYRQDMETKNSSTTRMIEGGHFNVNIRRIKAPSTEFHKVTIDTWVVLEGSGTVNTGFQTQDGKRVPGTGETFPAKVGDVFFVPSSLNHGFSMVNGTVAWLNVRWDDDYGTK